MKRIMVSLLAMMILAAVANGAPSSFVLPLGPVICDSSATPDPYGYTWVDNDNGGSPVYRWVDITTIGTRVMGLADDNVVGPFQIGFNFPYYWYEVNRVFIGSNGYISFSSNANYSQQFAVIPSTSLPNDIVAPLAGDIDFTDTSSNPRCYYYTNNVDTFIVSWINVREWNRPTSLHTFQLILCKRDSSITFQYGTQIGTFDNQSPVTHSSQIGIEDLLGRNGLNYMSNWSPADRVPHDGLVVRIHANPNPSFVFHDVGVKGSMNPTSGAVFCRVQRNFTPKALIKNYGTADESNIQVNCLIRKGFVTYYNKNVTIPSLARGAEAWAVFPDTMPDAVDQYLIVFRTTMTGDQYSLNNRDTAEMRAYVLPSALGYVSDTIETFFSWQGGGGGWANEFEIPEPVNITGVQFAFMSDGVNRFYINILPADADGNPNVNQILWADTLQQADTGWISVNVQPNVEIAADQKFFVAILSGGEGNSQGVDQVAPFSNRGWEYTTSYATSRDRETQDIAIRVVCAATTGIEQNKSIPSSFRLDQNYPNPFNARTEISFELAKPSEVSLEVYNVIGQKIRTLFAGQLAAGSHVIGWDGTNDDGGQVSSGVYFYRLVAENASQTKKMVLLK